MQLQLEKKLVELEKKLVELEKKLVEHRQISQASPFVMSLTSSASRFDSFVCDDARHISANHPSMGTHVKVVIPWVIGVVVLSAACVFCN